MSPLDAPLLERLRAALVERGDRAPRLRLAVLFGSRAKGSAAQGSDFDVGIVPDDAALPLGDELALAAELSGVVVGEVDVVRLDQDDALLGREVAQTGICLLEAHPGLFSAYRATAMSRWIEFDETFAPHRTSFLRRLARART